MNQANTAPATSHEPKYSRWFECALAAYTKDEHGEETPNFLDENGELVEGIYFGVPNDVYHALPALSSSKIKDFAKQATRYAKTEVHNIERRVTTAQQKTFDAGTIAHAVSLEPLRFFDEYFRLPVQSDYPDALHTNEQINQALCEAGLPLTEGRTGKRARLVRANPNETVSPSITVRDLDALLVKNGLSKSESKAEKGLRLMEADPSQQVFELIVEAAKAKQGEPSTVHAEDGEVTLYGGKMPVSGQMWDDAMRIVQVIRKHPEAVSALSNGFAEVTMIARCSVTGLWIKAKFDWLSVLDTAADVKTTLSTVPSKFKRQVKELKYDVQDAFYCYVAEMLGIHIRTFTFVAVEFVNAINCQPFMLKRQWREDARAELVESLEALKRRMDSNNWLNDFEEPVVLEI